MPYSNCVWREMAATRGNQPTRTSGFAPVNSMAARDAGKQRHVQTSRCDDVNSNTSWAVQSRVCGLPHFPATTTLAVSVNLSYLDGFFGTN